MEVITNNVSRELLSWHDLPEDVRDDFDYVDDKFAYNFVKYLGSFYDVSDSVAIDHVVRTNAQFADWKGWHSYISDTYFSGVLFKFPDDYERVIVGRYYS